MSEREQNYMQQDRPIEQQDEIVIEDNKSQFSDDFQSDQENLQNMKDQKPKPMEMENIPKVSNPINAYNIFMREWRQKHAGQKMSMATIGEVWKQMTSQQKEIYEKKFAEERKRYEDYQALMLTIDPNFGKKSKSQSKNYFFPLHRIKTIMKLDQDFAASTQNVSTMARATQYFGEYLLEQVKKSAEGKKRIDIGDLFEAVNNCQSNLWFLNCLIDEHNMENVNPNKMSEPHMKKVVRQQRQHHEVPNQKQKISSAIKTQKAAKHKPKNELPKGQLKLTDMF